MHVTPPVFLVFSREIHTSFLKAFAPLTSLLRPTHPPISPFPHDMWLATLKTAAVGGALVGSFIQKVRREVTQDVQTYLGYA